MKPETKVGLFVIVGFLMLFGLTTQVGTFKFGKKDGYPIYVEIPDASGLELNAKVKSRGIDIGSVEEFLLKRDLVGITLTINKEIKIPLNSIVSIKQESMLGVKYVDIEFSKDGEYAKSSDVLSNTRSYASFDQTSDSINEAAKKVDKFIARLDSLVAKNEKNLNDMIYNFKVASAEFRETGRMINAKLPQVLNNFEDVGSEFKQTGVMVNEKLPKVLDKFENVGSEFETTGKTINDKLPPAMDKFTKIEDTVQGVLDENRETLKSAIKNVDTAFVGVNKASVKVESSFDKLDKYLSSATKSTLGIEAKVEHMVKDSYNKSYFGIDYSPKPTIHYLADIIATDDYRLDSTTGLPKTTPLHDKGRTMFSAQYGKDFGDARVRGGIIESTGGFGADYFMLNKKLKLSVDSFDFNAYNDVRGNKAHLKSYLTYTMKKHIQLYTGYDNFLNPQARNLFFGLGVKFEDDDLKYLIGSSAASIK
ncbi:MAG: MlaD family protein [Arcobacteraceae bacterium]|jgi:phospholipid/cholesterol/gamma-HCH transport system substrate-binding protein|nr:MlaD family protein [Arcobacteraceae bacterium]